MVSSVFWFLAGNLELHTGVPGAVHTLCMSLWERGGGESLFRQGVVSRAFHHFSCDNEVEDTGVVLQSRAVGLYWERRLL
jgi:hypothetical protein